mgnify:CR=1 FL=1
MFLYVLEEEPLVDYGSSDFEKTITHFIQSKHYHTPDEMQRLITNIRFQYGHGRCPASHIISELKKQGFSEVDRIQI